MKAYPQHTRMKLKKMYLIDDSHMTFFCENCFVTIKILFHKIHRLHRKKPEKYPFQGKEKGMFMS